MSEYVKIRCCGDCALYNWNKHKCSYGAHVEMSAQEHFYRDCPKGICNDEEITEQKWISVNERLPEPEKDVLIAWKSWNGKLYVSTAFYENGKVNTENSDYAWNDDCDFQNYDEEADAYIIPEGWYESARFAEMFGVVDMVVTHWMPLPKPPKMDAEK